MPQLEVADLHQHYRELGERGGPAVLLIHGWPDNATTWDAVAPALAATGRRVIVPTLRGFGETRFRDDDAARTGNSAMLAIDMKALLDALGIERVTVIGHDWGSNIAEAMAVAWPMQVERIALLSTPPRLGGVPTPPFRHAQLLWYHWLMATARGADAVAKDRKGFAHITWENWAPKGWFDEATFDAVAESFDNPDWVDVTLHSYRSRWGETEPDPRSAWLERAVKDTKTLSLPALYIQGEADGVNPPKTSEKVAEKFTGPFQRVVLPGVGHFPQREASAEVAEILTAFIEGDRSI
jgi:pimeloyl-ACP methyl ester carboxylesterase